MFVLYEAKRTNILTTPFGAERWDTGFLCKSSTSQASGSRPTNSAWFENEESGLVMNLNLVASIEIYKFSKLPYHTGLMRLDGSGPHLPSLLSGSEVQKRSLMRGRAREGRDMGRAIHITWKVPHLPIDSRIRQYCEKWYIRPTDDATRKIDLKKRESTVNKGTN